MGKERGKVNRERVRQLSGTLAPLWPMRMCSFTQRFASLRRLIVFSGFAGCDAFDRLSQSKECCQLLHPVQFVLGRKRAKGAQAFIADMVGAVAAIKRHAQDSFKCLRCSMSARSIGRPTACFSAIMSSMQATTMGTSPARKVTAWLRICA